MIEASKVDLMFKNKEEKVYLQVKAQKLNNNECFICIINDISRIK